MNDEDPIVLKILHTADWHLGRPFPSFGEGDRIKLSRARLDVLRNIFGVADSFEVDAVLCAGDLFDEPRPTREWTDGLAEILQKHHRSERPVVLLPGNHDPLMAGSVWHPDHEVRRRFPASVHVVDRLDFELPLGEDAVLYARPCTSTAGQDDPALALPARAEGDDRIRIGMVHGSTHEVPDWQQNYPLDPEAATKRGLDYLAIGDTHAFRIVPLRDGTLPTAPTVYPGAPEATNFGERETGSVVVAHFRRRSRLATLHREHVAYWRWRTEKLSDLEDLRRLCREDLARTVLQLELDMSLPPAELDEAERLLTDLEGNRAKHGLAGITAVDRSELRLDTQGIEAAFATLPEVLQSAAHRLKEAESGPQAEVARRALYHLYRMTRDGASEET